MKTAKYILMLSVAVQAMAACTQNDVENSNILPEGAYPLVIKATGLSSSTSRATVDGDWQNVNEVALQVGTNSAVKKYSVTPAEQGVYTNVILSNTADPFYWTSREPIEVSAWWPYNENDLSMPDVIVKENQNILGNFQGSDYICAGPSSVDFENPTLEFTHRTARITIGLTQGTGVPSVKDAVVKLVGLSPEGGNPESIVAYKSDEVTFEALVAPQPIAQGTPFITVELNGGTYTYSPGESLSLAAGSRYNYTLKVNSKGLKLESCTITDWTKVELSGEAGIADYIYDKTNNTYTVYTAAGLSAWADYVMDGNMSTKCILANDIILPSVADGKSNWTPVGDATTPYVGTFDGNGHTISGITIALAEQNVVGFIGCVGAAGAVKNLALKNLHITGSKVVGGVVGSNDGSITSCYTVGTVSGTEQIGGVVGVNNGSLTASYSTATVTGTLRAGGVAGENVAPGSITACYWAGSLESGVGQGAGEVSKVDGTVVTWEDATTAMNTALSAANSEWNYVQLGGDTTTPPTLQKK